MGVPAARARNFAPGRDFAPPGPLPRGPARRSHAPRRFRYTPRFTSDPGDTVPRRFYITTAIDYVNGRPHLGHAYEKVLADTLARFHRQRGDATWFLTGTDEHGQKIARAAEAAGQEPQAFVDAMSQTFVSAWKALGVAYDQFIRTSDKRHELAVQELMRRLVAGAHPPHRRAGDLRGRIRRPLLRGLRGLQGREGARREGPLPRAQEEARRRSRSRTSSSGSPSTTRRSSSTSRPIRNSSSPTTAAPRS